MALRLCCLLLCLLAAGCSHYGRTMLWENKLKPTPDRQPANTPDPSGWSDDVVTYSWLGHATVLLNMQGTTILTDPVLLQRIGPPEIFDNAFGIRRISRLPLPVEALPPIDIVLISHAHYDHLDLASLQILARQQASPPLFIVPRDTRDMVDDHGDQVVELDWRPGRRHRWQDGSGLEISAFRVEHYAFTGSGYRDKPRGFNGYEISHNGKTVLYFGDTSYRRYRDEHGRALAEPVNVDWRGKFSAQTVEGRPALCILPIGDAYYYWNHTGPAEALAIARDVNCRNMLPVHYDTFLLTPPDKAPASMKQAFVDAAQPFATQLSFACDTGGGRYRFPDIGVSCHLK